MLLFNAGPSTLMRCWPCARRVLGVQRARRLVYRAVARGPGGERSTKEAWAHDWLDAESVKEPRLRVTVRSPAKPGGGRRAC